MAVAGANGGGCANRAPPRETTASSAAPGWTVTLLPMAVTKKPATRRPCPLNRGRTCSHPSSFEKLHDRLAASGALARHAATIWARVPDIRLAQQRKVVAGERVDVDTRGRARSPAAGRDRDPPHAVDRGCETARSRCPRWRARSQGRASSSACTPPSNDDGRPSSVVLAPVARTSRPAGPQPPEPCARFVGPA